MCMFADENDEYWSKSYDFTGETKTHNGHILHRIRRRSDRKLGGWIESEQNLSHSDSCWVDDNAMVYGNAMVGENARVYGNAEICDRVIVKDSAKVYGNAKISGRTTILYNSEVYDDAIIDGSEIVIDSGAKIYGKAQIHGYARIIKNSEIYGNVYIHGSNKVYEVSILDSKIYGNTRIEGENIFINGANIYENVKIYSEVDISSNVKIYGNAIIFGKTEILNNAEIYGDVTIHNKKIHPHTIISGNKTTLSDLEKSLKEFVYKIKESSKLQIQLNHHSLYIITVDTKVPIIKIEKTKEKDKKIYKFIVDITNKDGDNFSMKSIIDTSNKFNQLLQSTINALKEYQQFAKYADDLEQCL